jgi:predicted nucleic acid-binding Zn ribbon protein
MISKGGLRRPCRVCSKMFEPSGKFCRTCDKCNKKILDKKRGLL